MIQKYSTRMLLSVTALIILNGYWPVFAQAPNILYATPQTYTVNKTIPNLSPVNRGGPVPATIYGVTTFSGSTAKAPNFSAITGIKDDGQGNMYVTDNTQRLMKITPDGLVTVIAGQKNIPGYANGPGASALFDNPGQITTDAAGNIYVADVYNNRIRKVAADGSVTTFAGTGTAGASDGAAATATFNHPSGIAFDAGGNLYVADFNNDVIRKITPAGMVSIFAGSSGKPGSSDGTGASARFSGPDYLATDALGNVYVSDYNNFTIRKITPSGIVTTLAGNGKPGFSNGVGAMASFGALGGLAVDGYGNVLVADKANNVIRKIATGGAVTTFAGNGVKGTKNGYLLTASFNGPQDVEIDPKGNIFVAEAGYIREIESGGYVIDKTLPAGLAFDPTTGIISGTPTLASPSTDYTITAYNIDGSGSFTINITVTQSIFPIVNPPVISYQSPQIYSVNKTISPLIPQNNGGAVPATVFGQVTTLAGSGNDGFLNGQVLSAYFKLPADVVSISSGDIVVSDHGNNMLRLISGGAVTTYTASAVAGSADGTKATARFNGPAGLGLDVKGNIYVADQNNNLVRKVATDGSVTTIAGSAAVSGSANGKGAAASFNSPSGAAVDQYSNIYIADRGNNMIRKIAPDGTVTTLAGQTTAGSSDGNGIQAMFSSPDAVAVDSSETIYVADQGNNMIRKITSDGTVTAFAGNTASGSSDGKGTAARFNNPMGVACTETGAFIYVSDSGNNTIRMITPDGNVITLAGSGTAGKADGIGRRASFNHPYGLSPDESGNLYVADSGNDLVRKVITTGYTIDKPLPAGLSFDPKTGIISGTPTVITPSADYTVTAYNTGGSSSYTINITIGENIKSQQAITFGPLAEKTYGDPDFDPGAISNNNTIPVTYTSSDPAVATIVNGNIHITGAGTDTITATQSGNDDFIAATPVIQVLTVVPAQLTITADDKTKVLDSPNPVLTASYSGFVYHDGPPQLLTQPVLTTTAITSSPAGSYPITVMGASSANYVISYVPGTLTVILDASSIIIPNVFTPNGDGINDFWDIASLTYFPRCVVSVYARNGSLVFQSKGYARPWDGTYHGSALPNGTYYYIIDPQEGMKQLSGSVTILR